MAALPVSVSVTVASKRDKAFTEASRKDQGLRRYIDRATGEVVQEPDDIPHPTGVVVKITERQLALAVDLLLLGSI